MRVEDAHREQERALQSPALAAPPSTSFGPTRVSLIRMESHEPVRIESGGAAAREATRRRGTRPTQRANPIAAPREPRLRSK